MKTLLDFLKTTLVGGLLGVAPVWISLLLILKALAGVEAITRPIGAALPEQVDHPLVLAALLLLAGCFTAGLVVRTRIGRYTQEAVERYLRERLPGYASLRDMSEGLVGINRDRGFLPALAQLGDGLVPVFLVERHPDARCTVFVPDAPKPLSGSIHILPAGRVHLVDVPLVKALHCISRYGAGSSALLAALRPTDCGAEPAQREIAGSGPPGPSAQVRGDPT